MIEMDILRQLSKENIKTLKKALEGYTDYLPTRLVPLVPNYIPNATEEAHSKIFEIRNNQPGGKENDEYFNQEILDWLDENEEYKKYFEEIL